MSTENDSINPLRSLLSGIPPDFEPPLPDSPRGRIIAAAKEHFAKHGFSATSIRAIAGTANVNLAMVNYYYSSKKALYQRVIIAELIGVFRAIQSRLPPGLSPDKIVLLLPLSIANVMRDNPIWVQLVRRELADGAPIFRAIFDEMGGFGPKGVKEILITAYSNGVLEGTLKNMRPEIALATIIALGYGMVILDPLISIVAGRQISDDELWQERLEAMKTILLEGLAVTGKGSD